MSNKTLCWSALSAWIAFWMATAGTMIDKVAPASTFTGMDFAKLAFFLLATAALGYNAGKSEDEK